MYFQTKIEKQDIEEIVNSKFINWKRFKNSTILVTGATGMIGSMIVKAIIYANENLKTNIKILALVRNKKKIATYVRKNISCIVQDISKPIKTIRKVDFIIHTANSTSSKGFVEEPVETINSIILGTKNVLEFAKNKKVKSLVYLSSMEVFGQTDFDRQFPLEEKDYGYIDISKVRSSYPEGKRLAENMCVAYAKEYSVPVKVARLVQTIGAGVDYSDNRVFAQFARNIVERKDIILHTAGETVRSYCYITDVISSIFVLLDRGKSGEFYNVANEQTTCSIKQMAQLLCEYYTSSKLVFELDNPMNNYYLPKLKTFVSSSKLRQLEWQPNVPLLEMFNRLIQDFYLRQKPLISNSQKEETIKKRFLRFCYNKSKKINYDEFTIFGKSFLIKRKNSYSDISRKTEIQNNKIILLDNHDEGYCGHLKYIAEELIAQNVACEIVWIDKFENKIEKHFPPQIRKVKKDTIEAAKELASAKVWVASQRMNKVILYGLKKKNNQYYIQTWHGSLGIKKVGFDVNPTKEEAWMDLAKKEAMMVDFLISNSDFENNVYRGIFWGQGKSLLFGHPRNDVFFKENKNIREKVYKSLGISLDKKLILYAPTFRDDKDLTCYNMDYNKVIQDFEKKFGEECVLCVRFHPWALSSCEHLFANNNKIINGNKYEDIQELMVATDFMITDYSSCIFDFMLTRKPAFIYASDIEKYNNERGFYYSLDTTPFPIATNMEDFSKNILSFDLNSYDSKLDDFLKSKGCVEDGKASERVVSLIKELMRK